MSKVDLAVNGNLYTNWKKIGITRTIEAMAGSFSLDVADHWIDHALGWPIREEDECQVKIDGQTVIDGWVTRRSPAFSPTTKTLAYQGKTVIDGWVTRRSPAFSPTTKTLAYQGKGRPVALVECSAVLGDWAFRNKTVIEIARKLAAPYGIGVTAQAGLETLKAPRKVAVSQGDTGFTVLDAVAKAAGVMVVSDGAGGILITRSGTARASQDLIEGENLIGGSADYDVSGRFGKYIVSTQIPSTDNAHGKAARISAEAFDNGVQRDNRTLLIRPDTGLTKDSARRRADWEARIRAAKGATATAIVHGWKQSDGKLWPLNVLIRVKSKTLDMDEDMLISQAEHVKGDSGGEITTLRLVRPDAFTPDPDAIVKERSGGASRNPFAGTGATR